MAQPSVSRDIRIRRLPGDDVAAMRQLNMIFGAVFDDSATYVSNPPSDDYVVAFLSNPTNIVLVAEEAGQVVGGLVAYVLRKFEMERTEVYVYDLAVSRDYQRRGIGSSLMRYLQTVGHDIGAYVVFVQADEGDEAVEFYESLKPDTNNHTRNFDFSVHPKQP